MGGFGSPSFVGRTRELQRLDELLRRVRNGEGRVLVIRGEPGIGKSALMNQFVRRTTGCQVVRISGVESEMELPFAALHQLCAPMVNRLDVLPEPQEKALKIAFGLAHGQPPDPFVVALAALSLLSELSSDVPVVCLIDDAQWLDEASAQVLGFVGRRLLAERVLLLFGVRDEAGEAVLGDLPSMTLDGLDVEDAASMLSAAVLGRLDERVRDRVVAEVHGHPLALLELAKSSPKAELAGGFIGDDRLTGRLHDHYLERIGHLPPATQKVMLLAAADPTGNPALVWRAARTLGLSRQHAVPAESENLLESGVRIRFLHPLVRSAAYASGTDEERRSAHLALAEATDSRTDPERRVWHRAAAAAGPDEQIAAELVEAAARAQARAGAAAAAAFLRRAAVLTAEPRTRADRTLAAAEAHLRMGALEEAGALLGQAEADAADDLQRARVERLRSQVDWAASPGPKAPVRLLHAAAVLAPLDVRLARETYLDAWVAALVAGRLADPGGRIFDVSTAARTMPTPHSPLPGDLLLDGLATVPTDGLGAAAPILRRALDAFIEDSARELQPWGGSLAWVAAACLWDFDSWVILSTREVERARAAGALAPMSIALSGECMVSAWRGDLERATAIMAEQRAVAEATGIRMFPVGVALLAAYRGRQSEGLQFMSTTRSQAAARGEGNFLQAAYWTTAILHNGLGRYRDALTAARQAVQEADVPHRIWWVLPEVVEAAVREGQSDIAIEALQRLSASTVNDSDWATGIEARCRALLAEGEAAEQLYLDAEARLGRTQLRPELARAHLLHGEWLVGSHRPDQAREQFRKAFRMFSQMGAEAFAERARRGLLGTGERVRRPETSRVVGLTAQEEHIARLARDGRSNTEIGAELFLSARTVEWHLGKVFTKLGITSRRGLVDALPGVGETARRE